MKKRIRKAFAWLLVFLILPLFLASGSYSKTSFLADLKIDQIDSLEEMQAVLSVVKTSAADAVGTDTFTSAFQKTILARAGECISRLAYLCRMEKYDPDAVRRNGKALFMANGDIIKHVLTTNEEKIAYLQENVLDTLEDPLAFFQTAQWQDPQQLISLSSYWLGWNGYYASLVIPESDPERNRMLMDAINGFSRAFVDFEEEAVIAKSLYGRGLCYRQLKDFQKALNDFETVKDRIKKDDSMYARCLYEEASIGYETGNFRLTLSKLDKIQELFSIDGIPESMTAGIEKLRADVLLSQLEKKAEQTGRQTEAGSSKSSSAFDEMKKLAVQHGRINKSFYRYVQTNVKQLKALSYHELGPVAALAIGDWYYGRQDYDKTLSYYRQLQGDVPLPFDENLDLLKYRTAYIFFMKHQWREVVKLLYKFHEDFPESRLAGEAALLYYTAASRLYRENEGNDAYETYIDSIQVYLAVCDCCEGRSDAHFQLGGYYRKVGKHDRAIIEFSAVGDDSPNFFQAKYYVLESCLDQLDMLSKKGGKYAKEMKRTYREGLGVIDEYRQAAPGGEKAAANREKLRPYIAALQAKFCLYGDENTWKSGLQLVQEFEKQYPEKTILFPEAAKLRIVYFVRLQREKAFETEINRFIGDRPIDPSRYAALQDLADNFYTKSKITITKTEESLASHIASAALAIYEKLRNISLENAAYENYCEPIELRMAEICMKENCMDRAAELYTSVLRRNQQSADAVYGLGLVYERQGQWRQALQTWRKFSDGVASGTYHWFQSRYRTAVALSQLGETERACKVITMTRVLHPNFGDDELERNFRELESNFCKGETAQ